MEGFVERLPVKQRREPTFYHDPCHLGRWMGVYEPPRRLLRKTMDDVREFSRSRNQSECSGGGGLLPATMPEAADAIASARLTEVKQAGASTVVSSCPTCTRRLNRDGVQALDLIEVLAQAVAD